MEVSQSKEVLRTEYVGQRARIAPAFASFVVPVALLLILRLFILEPFLIPSGSMMPTLLVGDFVVVNKLKYGVRLPLVDFWLLQWASPKKGDVVVFKSPENPDQYFVKRLMATPGDTISVRDGIPSINGTQNLQIAQANEEDLDVFLETNRLDHTYSVQYERALGVSRNMQERTLGADEYFFMGDNRDHSSDSRVWGVVKQSAIIGPVWAIWLSCSNEVGLNPLACDFTTRIHRLFTVVR